MSEPGGTSRLAVAGARIVFVNSFPGPGMGGGENQLRTVIDGCLSAGMRVTVVCPRGSGLIEALSQRNVTLVESDFGLSQLPSTILRIRRLIQEAGDNGPSGPRTPLSRCACILQGTGFLTNLVTRVAATGVRRASLVNAIHVESGASIHDGGSRAGLLFRTVLDRLTRHRVDRFVAVSSAVARSLGEPAAKEDAGRVVVIRNGVDPGRIRKLAEGPLPTGIPPDPTLLVGVVGRLEPIKGVETFLRAAHRVSAQRADVLFVIAGTGSQARELEALSSELGISGRVRFLGHVSPVAPLLTRLGLLVIPSFSEGLPMAALEAMALGVPVVATSVGGVPEVIEDGVSGWLVPPAEPQALADAILGAITDRERAAQAGTAGRGRLEAEFTLGRMTEEYLELYSRLLFDTRA